MEADGTVSNVVLREGWEKAGRQENNCSLLSPAEVSVDNVRGGLSLKFVGLFFSNPSPLA